MSRRVLVIEDEEDIRELILFTLRHEGYEALGAANGAQALALAHTTPPDLIILDLMLPDLDGISLCEIFRHTPATAALPILMLTAWSTLQARHLGLHAGADDYMAKPFSPRDLLRRLEKLSHPRPAATAP